MDDALSRVVNALPGVVGVTLSDGRADFLNQRWYEYTGVRVDAALGVGWQGVVHPEDLPGVLERLRGALSSSEPAEIEARLRGFDGAYRRFIFRLCPLTEASDQIVTWCGVNVDVEDRRQREAESRLSGEKQLLEMVACGRPLSEILEAICGLVESMVHGCYCSIALLDESGTRLKQGAAPSLPPTFITSIIGRLVSVDSGPSAMASCLNEQVIAADLASEARWPEWCAMARSHGLHACWSAPISSSSGKVLGAFGIYYNAPCAPSALQQSLIDQFMQIARIAVERAVSDAALKASEAHKAAILDSALDCIVTIDHEGRITEFNPAAERTFGYRREQVIGEELAEVMIPASIRETHRRGFARYLATGETRVLGRRVELMAVRADGSEFPVELAITRMPSDGPPSFTGFLRDVAERKQSIEDRNRAEALLAGENRLLQMVASGFALADVLASLCRFVEEAAPECICATYLIDWSVPVFKKGAAPSLPASFLDAVDGLPVRAELCPCAVAALHKRQVIAEDVESDPFWQDTAYCGLLLTHGLQSVWSTPIFALSGSVLGTFAIYHRHAATPSARVQELIAQVTHIASIAIERAHDEAALKRSEAFLAQGQHLSSTGSFAWRVDSDDVTFSDELSRIFEFDRGHRVTLTQIASRIHPEDLPLLLEQIEVARRTGRNIDYDLRLHMPDNSVKYVRTIAHASRDQNERVEYIGAVQDVTARRVSEQALERARSELAHVARVTTIGALTASIAHEVNQPLSGIITNASTCLRMLAADSPDIEGARETAKRTIRDGNRASEVIARLRALFTKKEFTMEPIDVNEATREVIALSASELQRSRVVLHQDFGDDLPMVVADRVQLQQVILNLLLNAADAMNGINDRPRRLVISTKRGKPDHVCVAVRDVGVGLERQNADKVFDAFYTTKSGGMGIGLSVSRSIVERHHGRLWAEPNDGPGTTFSFSIPLDPAGVANAAQVMRSF